MTPPPFGIFMEIYFGGYCLHIGRDFSFRRFQNPGIAKCVFNVICIPSYEASISPGNSDIVHHMEVFIIIMVIITATLLSLVTLISVLLPRGCSHIMSAVRGGGSKPKDDDC